MGIFGQTSFPTVPATFLAAFQSLRQTTGIPISWFAAAAQATSFNPNFETHNLVPVASVRQIGLAGLWLDIPELSFLGGAQFGYACGGFSVDGGWAPYSQRIVGIACGDCPNIPPPDQTVSGNLLTAAAIFSDCSSAIQSIFGNGQFNAGVMYRFVLGCNYIPQKDPASGDFIIPAIPQGLAAYAQLLLEAQAFYAPTFGEDALLYGPGPTPTCPPGFTWNSLTSLCCNPLNQCQPAIACPTGTVYDPATNTCKPIPCGPNFPCIPPLVCQTDGSCKNVCGPTLPCGPGFVCDPTNICVPPCNPATNPCPTGFLCQGGICVPCGGTGLPCCAGGVCSSGFSCVGGTCQPNCGSGPPCVPPQVCQGGTCVTPPPPSSTPWLAILLAIGLPVAYAAAVSINEKYSPGSS